MFYACCQCIQVHIQVCPAQAVGTGHVCSSFLSFLLQCHGINCMPCMSSFRKVQSLDKLASGEWPSPSRQLRQTQVFIATLCCISGRSTSTKVGTLGSCWTCSAGDSNRTLTGGRETLRGGSEFFRGSSGALTGGSRTLKGGSGSLRGSKTLRRSSASLHGGNASLVSQYAAALHTIAAAHQLTGPAQLHSLSPLSHFCCGRPCALPPQSSSVEFDIGMQPHLTPRYTQGVLAMTKQHESAVSLLSNPASCSAPPHCEHLVRQQAQLPCAQGRPQGILANRHAATTSLRSNRDLCAAYCRVCLLPKMTRAPPACSCCTACGRAFESQLVGVGRPAFRHPSRSSDRILEGCDRICRDGGTPCRDDSRACRDGGRTWSMSSTRGSLPQAGKAQLAGNTSRALERMALSLRYSRGYHLILESHCP